MSVFQIPGDAVDLVLQTPEEVLAWVESLPPEIRVEVSPNWIERVKATPAGDPWALSYSVIHRATGEKVGGCAFKGPPNAEGVVEISYGIDEPHRGHGYATAAAQALCDFAKTQSQVRLVIAHTRPNDGPSPRILTKLGFTKIGEVIDPEDGLVWRWELRGR